MAYDLALSARLHSALKNQLVTEKKMFGGVAFLLNGNMLVGIHGDNLIARVGPDNYEACLSRPHTKPFDMTGRPKSGWVEVLPAGLEKIAQYSGGYLYALSTTEFFYQSEVVVRKSITHW